MEQATALLKEFDFREADVPKKALVIQVEQSVIDAGMSDAAERFLTIEPADDGIRTGDIVRIAYPDGTEGEKQAQFSAGRYFFDQSLEDAILGMTRGQTAELPVEGQVRPVQILSVKRRHIPVLTDQAVTSLEIEGVNTVEEYRQHLIDREADRKREKRAEFLKDWVGKQVIEQSAFTPVDRESGEYRSFYDGQINQAKKYAAQGEDASEAEILRMMLGLKEDADDGELQTTLAAFCDRQVKLLALGRAHAARDGVAFTAEDCEAELRQFAEQHNVPYEELRKDYAPEKMVPGRYIQYYEQKIVEYFERQYTVTVG